MTLKVLQPINFPTDKENVPTSADVPLTYWEAGEFIFNVNECYRSSIESDYKNILVIID